jgi:hypothetical protein
MPFDTPRPDQGAEELQGEAGIVRGPSPHDGDAAGYWAAFTAFQVSAYSTGRAGVCHMASDFRISVSPTCIAVTCSGVKQVADFGLVGQ